VRTPFDIVITAELGGLSSKVQDRHIVEKKETAKSMNRRLKNGRQPPLCFLCRVKYAANC
jgi:hypothetical protein